jgi:two-component system, NtrC family, sensor kinase
MMSKEPFNTRILVVDDEEVIRDSFREIFDARRRSMTGLDAAEAELFGAPSRALIRERPSFEVDYADSGQAALARVQEAAVRAKPFAAIFLDMRMPGWSGLETAQRIREIDQNAEIVFVTAFSDHSIDEITDRAGTNIGYHCKPFSPEEIRQLATKCVYDWNKLRGLEGLIRLTSSLQVHVGQVEVLLTNILGQVTESIGTSSALLVRLGEAPAPLYATGKMLVATVAESAITWMSQQDKEDIQRSAGYIYFPMASFGVAAILEDGADLKTEKLYLLRLFLQHAAATLENARLSQKLVQNEKLAAVGEAMSKVIHDLRQPLAVIKMECALIREHDDAGLQESAAAIDQSVDDLTAYIGDVMSFARGVNLKVVRGAAADLFTEVQRQCRAATGETNVRIESVASSDARFAYDRQKLCRALCNVVVNAVEALHQAGIEAPLVRMVAERTPGGVVRISVTDNGPGIPSSIAATLFEPFVSHGKSGGTGLGLAIARQIVEAHAGRVSFESGAGGTTFQLDFPASDDAGEVRFSSSPESHAS